MSTRQVRKALGEFMDEDGTLILIFCPSRAHLLDCFEEYDRFDDWVQSIGGDEEVSASLHLVNAVVDKLRVPWVSRTLMDSDKV